MSPDMKPCEVIALETDSAPAPESIARRLQLLAEMEHLPDGAQVGIPHAAAWLDHHEVTVRRMVYDGQIKTPKGRRRNARIKIRMGELRRLTGG